MPNTVADFQGVLTTNKVVRWLIHNSLLNEHNARNDASQVTAGYNIDQQLTASLLSNGQKPRQSFWLDGKHGQFSDDNVQDHRCNMSLTG